jgi:uncharacterized membrane protein
VAALSISRAWDDTRATLRRNGRLLLPIAFAFGVLPGTLVGVAIPTVGESALTTPGELLLFSSIISIISLIGAIAIQRLSLLSGEPVSRAIREGVPRALKMFVTLLIVLVPVSLLLSPLMPALVHENEAVRARASGMILAALLVALIPLSRLLLTLPISAVEKIGPLRSISQSWKLTKKNTFRLFGLNVLTLSAWGLLTWAALTAIGSVVLLVAGQPEPWTLSALLFSLISQLVQSIVAVPFLVLIARLYFQALGDQNVSVPHAP